MDHVVIAAAICHWRRR